MGQTFNRASVPEEFYDKTSSLLLVQPEPQYLYAQMYLGALGLSLNPESALGINSPNRQITGVGADYSTADRDRLMLANPMFTDVIAAKVDFNAAPGSTVRINRPVFANTTYTESSRRIASGATISTNSITVGSQQTNLTLFRYGGPYDGTQVAPYAIEHFDSNMGVHNAVKMHGTHLVRDCHKFLEKVHVSLLDLASVTVYPSGMTANNDATTAGSFPFTYAQLLNVKQKMDTANLPYFADGYRALVLTPQQVEQLANDANYSRAAINLPQYNALFPTYISSVSKFHVFVSTTLTGADGLNTNSSSVNINQGHAIAPGVLLGGMGRPLRVMPASDDNYGESVKVIWLGDLAFGLANNTFVVSVRSSS